MSTFADSDAIHGALARWRANVANDPDSRLTVDRLNELSLLMVRVAKSTDLHEPDACDPCEETHWHQVWQQKWGDEVAESIHRGHAYPLRRDAGVTLYHETCTHPDCERWRQGPPT